MNPKHRETFDIYYYYLDEAGKILPSALLKFAQETANRHLSSFGYSYDFLRGQSTVFLLTKVALEIKKSPGAGERITVETWSEGARGAAFYRPFIFYNSKGDIIARQNSQWALVDYAARKIIRPADCEYDFSHCDDTIDDLPLPKKLRERELYTHVGTKEIRYTDLDVNAHLNNTKYADIACDYLDENFIRRGIKNIGISFIKEVPLRAALDIYVRYIDADTASLYGVSDGKICFEGQVKGS